MKTLLARFSFILVGLLAVGQVYAQCNINIGSPSSISGDTTATVGDPDTDHILSSTVTFTNVQPGDTLRSIWQRNGVDIAGSLTASQFSDTDGTEIVTANYDPSTYEPAGEGPGIDTQDHGNYSVRFEANCGSGGSATPQTSSDRLLSVVPKILVEPSNSVVAIDGSVDLQVSAQGSNLIYTWYHKGSPISDGAVWSGQGTPSLTVNLGGISDVEEKITYTYNYYVRVSHDPDVGSDPTTNSDTAYLYITTQNPLGDGICKTPIQGEWNGNFLELDSQTDEPCTAGGDPTQCLKIGPDDWFDLEGARFFNGLGDCDEVTGFSAAGLPSGTAYRCDDQEDPARSSYYLHVPSGGSPVNTLNNSYQYQKALVDNPQGDSDWAIIPNPDDSTVSGNPSDIYSSVVPKYDGTADDVSESGKYRIALLTGPCYSGAAMGSRNVSRTVELQVEVIPVVIESTYASSTSAGGGTQTYDGLPRTLPAQVGDFVDMRVNTNFDATETVEYAWYRVDDPLTILDTDYRLTISDIQAGEFGMYQVDVTNPAGTVSQVFDVQGFVQEPTDVDLRGFPGDQLAQPGQNRVLQVVEGGEAFMQMEEGSSGGFGDAPQEFSWQKSTNGGASWTDIPGENFPYLFVTGISLADDNTRYRGVVTNAAANPFETGSMQLDVSAATPTPPTIVAQPQSQLGIDEGGTAFFNVQAIGTGTLNFTWRKGTSVINPGGRFQINTDGGSSSLTIIGVEPSDEASNYNVVVSNGTPPNATSVNVSLTVNPAPQAPEITTQPQSITVTEGEPAGFGVVATGSNLTYQWKKNGSDIAGATMNAYIISSAMESDEGAYSVRVTDSVSGLYTDSNPAVLTVDPIVCDAPAAATLVSPADGQELSSTSVNFDWNPVTPPAGCSVEYRVRWSASASSACNGSNASVWSSETEFSPDPLAAGGTYSWCVEARTAPGAVTASAVREFSTPAPDVTVPQAVLTIIPSDSEPDDRRGEIQIIANVSNASGNLIAEVYEVVNSDEPLVLVGSSEVSGGQVDISFEISDTTGVKDFEYKARFVTQTANPDDAQTGEFSESKFYYFDENLVIPPPEVIPSTQGESISWNSVPGAEEYLVYRRILKSSQCSGECYLNTPFNLIETIAADGSASYSYTDPNLLADLAADPENANEGASYFVVAKDGGQTSLRSDSTSREDVRSVFDRMAGGEITHKPSLAVRSLGDGRTAFYLEDLNAYRLDNSADVNVQIQYQRRLGSCDSFVFDDLDGSVAFGNVDALSRTTDPSRFIENAIFLGEVETIDPGESYCFEACITDKQGNTGSAGHGPDDPTDGTHCLSAVQGDIVDSTAPGFAGVSSVVALEDGTSLQVTYQKAETDIEREEPFIQYDIDYSTEPDFSDFRTLRVSDINQTTAVIEGLDSNQQYFVRAISFDFFENESEGQDQVVSAVTKNNYPSAVAEMRPTDQASIFEVNLRVTDRNLSQFADKSQAVSRLVGLYVGSSESSLQEVVNLDRKISRSSPVLTGLSTISGDTSSENFMINLSGDIQVKDLEGFYYKIVVEDPTGLRSEANGNTFLSRSLASSNSIGRDDDVGIVACSLSQKSKSAPLGVFSLLLLAIGLLGLRLARRKA